VEPDAGLDANKSLLCSVQTQLCDSEIGKKKLVKLLVTGELSGPQHTAHIKVQYYFCKAKVFRSRIFKRDHQLFFFTTNKHGIPVALHACSFFSETFLAAFR
jgi:hypothetical protein